MRDNEFEKQVREQLADFSLGSAPDVWPDVKAALHPEKKRRWMIWILLFVLTGLALNYGLLKQNERDKVVAERVSLKHKKTHESNNNLPQTERKEAKGISKDQLREKQELNKQKVEDGFLKTKNKELLKTDHTNKTYPLNNITAYPIKDTNAIAKTETVLRDSVYANKLKTLHFDLQPNNNQANYSMQKDLSRTEQKDSILTINIPDVKSKKVKPKWQINLFAEAGISGINDNAFNLFSGTNLDYYSSAPQNNNGGPVTSIYKLPKFEKGFSFGGGVQFYKQFSKRSALSIDAAYHLYQTKTSVGKRVALPVSFYELNIASNNYYTNTDSLQYMDHYHFVQSSVDYYLLLNIHHCLPLRWNIGGGAGYMFASNGLHYSVNGNSFIINNKLFYNPQFFISTGFELGIGNNHPLYVGPKWRYFISPFSKENFAKKSHLNSLSISVTVPFKK